jgi:hypothetical protein
MIQCGERLEVLSVPGIPLVGQGADIPALVSSAISKAGLTLVDGDVLVVTSKLLSRAEGRFVDVPRVEPSPRATELAREIGKDPQIVELILRESSAVSRKARGVLVVADEELTRAQNGVATGFVARLQTVRGRASLLNAYELDVGDPSYAQKDLDRYTRATKEGLLAVAKDFLDPNARVDLRVIPEPEAPKASGQPAKGPAVPAGSPSKGTP